MYTTLTVLGCFAVGIHLSTGYIAAVYGFSAGYMKHGVWQLGHLWSLGAEEQFYLLWPALLVLGYRHRAWIAVSMIIASALFRVSGIVDYTYSFPAVADSLAFGCLLSIASPLMIRLPRWVRSPGPTCLLIALTVGSVPFLHERNTLYWGIGPALIALSIFVLVERRDWLLNNRPSGTLAR